ncbi:hypothetical protein GE09DRAFT_1154618 [Coniochaeta sp. 2T2.1]|nr:hypothetical protein GE09DRAFT_1154618 [Coniochaeta sp. 2T2.1]
MGFQDIVSATANLAPFHLLSYSSLLGMSLYQSFTVVKMAHRVLPRPAFVTLQGRLFPIYFQLQTFYLFLTAATFPPYGPLSLIKDRISTVLFSVAGIGALLNFLIYGPRTGRLMMERNRKGTRDAGDDENIEEASEEAVDALNKAFHKSHAMSIHLNLITIAALIGYGWRLALRLKVE